MGGGCGGEHGVVSVCVRKTVAGVLVALASPVVGGVGGRGVCAFSGEERRGCCVCVCVCVVVHEDLPSRSVR